METRISREGREVAKSMSSGSDSLSTHATSGKTRLTHTSVTENTTYQMKVYEFLIEVLTSATYTTTVRLPNVSEARGKIYAIKLHTDGGQDITVQCYGDSDDAYGWSDLTIGTAGSGYVLYSDGESWWQLGTTY